MIIRMYNTLIECLFYTQNGAKHLLCIIHSFYTKAETHTLTHIQLSECDSQNHTVSKLLLLLLFYRRETGDLREG